MKNFKINKPSPIIFLKIFLIVINIILFSSICLAQTSQTSWTGEQNSNWNTSKNWSNGVPDNNTDAIIGDASFTGNNQPIIRRASSCKSLKIGDGSVIAELAVNGNLSVMGDITIGSNGSVTQSRNRSISLRGDWNNNGTDGAYVGEGTGSEVIFSGEEEHYIRGTTKFQSMTVNVGSKLNLAANNIINHLFTVNGRLCPSEDYNLSGKGDVIVNNGGTLIVMAKNFADNYGLTGSITLAGRSTIHYASSNIDQNISNDLTYGYLRISGGTSKTLVGNLPPLNSSQANAGRIIIDQGTLNLVGYTADRGDETSGGDVIIAADARLIIGGTNSFPSNYASVNLASTSTVEYGGADQTVSALTYGNLDLSSSGGSVTKTMAIDPLVVSGNLTLDKAIGMEVIFIANNTISVNGDVIIGFGCDFRGGEHTHKFFRNWANEGTFSGAGSTAIFSGYDATLSGSGVNDFHNLEFSGSGISAAGTTVIRVSGNLSSPRSGSFTHDAPGSLTMHTNSNTISGNGMVLHNLIIESNTTVTGDIDISGDFNAVSNFSAGSGTIKFTGSSKTISGNGPISFFTISVRRSISTTDDFSVLSNMSVASLGSFEATAGTVTFDGNSFLDGTVNLYNVTINELKTLSMGVNSVLGIANTFTPSGTFDVTTATPNTVNYRSANAQTVEAANYHHLILSNGNTKTASGNINIMGDFQVEELDVFEAGSFNHSLHGNFINEGTINAGTSLFDMVGSAPASISGVTTFNSLRLNKSNSDATISLLSNITTHNLDMVSGNMYTDANTISITSTRTGDGIIIGTIIRNHAFIDGTPYHFEGPQNAITFTNPDVALEKVEVTVKIEEVLDFIPGKDCVIREYIISIPEGTYTEATLRLHYEDNELNAFMEQHLSLYRFDSENQWDSIGVTSRNSDLNYVEKTGISPDISGRWTMSGLRNLVRWNGSVSSQWEDVENWTTHSGEDMTDRVPGENDAVQIGYNTFAYQPIIDSDQTVNSVIFGSKQECTLTINNNKSLTTNGSIKGYWESSASHVVQVANGTLNVGTNLVLSDGETGNDIELNIEAGQASLHSHLIQSAGSSVRFTGSGSLDIWENYNYSAGSFTAGSGTVTYRGSSSQFVAPVSYNNLTINKTSNQASINAPTEVLGDLTLSADGSLAIYDIVSIKGNVSIELGASLIHSTSDTVYVKGNWVNNGTYIVNNGIVCFNGTENQSISASPFNTLSVNKPSGILSLAGDISLQGDLLVISGSLDLGTWTASRNNPGGKLRLDADAVIMIAGEDNHPKNFRDYDIAASSTIEYMGSVIQQISDIAYGDLVLSNGGANSKELSADIHVNGNLQINEGATMDPGSYEIHLFGDFVNDGDFIPATSTLLLNGEGEKSFTGNTTLHNLTIASHYNITEGEIHMTGDLFVDVSGTLNLQDTDIVLDGNYTNRGATISDATATFTGERVQTIRLEKAISSSTGEIVFDGTIAPILNSTSSPEFATVRINNTAGITASVPWTVNVAMIIGPGAAFNGGAHTHTFNGHFCNYGTVISSGTLTFSPIYFPSDIMLDNEVENAFESSGEVIFGGDQPLTISGANADFNNVSIINTNAEGVSPHKSWSITENLYIGNGSAFYAGSEFNHTLSGNLIVNGVLYGETSTVTFTGNPSAISGLGDITFYNLDINEGADFRLNHFIKIAGDLSVKTADFNTFGNGITFTGSTPSTINSTFSPLILDYLGTDKNGSNETTLLVPVDINDDLVLEGGIIVTSVVNLLTLVQNAYSDPGAENSYVDGPVSKIGNEEFVFPVGNNGYWARIGISAPLSEESEFRASYSAYTYEDTTNIEYPLNNVSDNEYWILDRIRGTDNVNVTLYWEDNVKSGILDLEDIVVARYDGSTWVNET